MRAYIASALLEWTTGCLVRKGSSSSHLRRGKGGKAGQGKAIQAQAAPAEEEALASATIVQLWQLLLMLLKHPIEGAVLVPHTGASPQASVPVTGGVTE